jgi:ribulose-5-phosphate 4-epimerase/fuculose-1-phosphate aldolase
MDFDITARLQARRPVQYSTEEWRLRIQLAACYRIFDYLGWTELIYNHITVRVPGPERHYLINPSGLNYNEVTAANLIKIGLDGAPAETSPYHVNRAGFIIHSAIHAARDDAHCIMHVHTTAGMGVACKKEGLRYDDFYGAELLGDVAYHDFEGISVHADEQPRLVESLADKHVLILRNHGLLVAGGDIPSAFRWMWTLQRACEVQLAADTLRGDNIPLAQPVREACARDARAFEPRGKLEQMLFDSVLRRAGVRPESLL